MRPDLPESLTRGRAAALFVLEPGDATETYLGWMRDPAVQDFLESRFARHDLASLRAFIAAMADSDHSLFMGIRDAGGRHVGNIKLGPIDWQHGTGDIGLLIGDRAVHGRGIGTEAIGLICGIARHLGLAKVTAGAYEMNAGSIRAFEKAGFSIEGRRVAQFVHEGQRIDQVLMGRVLA